MKTKRLSEAAIRADERARIAARLREGARQTEIIGDGFKRLESAAAVRRADALVMALRQVADSVEKDMI